MIKLGKLPNGVALFNSEEMLRIVVQNDNINNILVCFGTEEYDKISQDGEWFVKDFDVLRKDNEDMCKVLDNLYNTYLDMVKKTSAKFTFTDRLSPSKIIRLFRTVNGDKLELLYPSEDTSLDNSTMFGITKYGDYGYMLTFHKSVNDKNKKSVYIKFDGSRIPELFPLYNKWFNDMKALATTDFKEANREFYNSISSDKHLVYKK